MDGLLAEPRRWTGGKQRLTATRLHELLITEGHRVSSSHHAVHVSHHRRHRPRDYVEGSLNITDQPSRDTDAQAAGAQARDVFYDSTRVPLFLAVPIWMLCVVLDW